MPDLGISSERLGDVYVAQGDLGSAMQAYQRKYEIISTLAASDPGHAGWQRDLSVSLNKVGDVQVAQGDLSGALESFSESLAIRERLAAADPGNAGWQRDLINSNVRLAVVSGNRAYYQKALDIARNMRDRGMLASRDAWMIAELNRLASVD